MNTEGTECDFIFCVRATNKVFSKKVIVVRIGNYYTDIKALVSYEFFKESIFYNLKNNRENSMKKIFLCTGFPNRGDMILNVPIGLI